MGKKAVFAISILAVILAAAALSIRACGVVDKFEDLGDEMSKRIKGVGRETSQLREDIERIKRTHEINWYISGYVYDMETHRPIADAAANVYGRGIETNENGFFELRGSNWQQGYVEWVEVKNRSLCRIEKEMSYDLDKLEFRGEFTIYLCNDQRDSTLEEIYDRFKMKYETNLTAQIRTEIENTVNQKWVEGEYTVMVRLWDIRNRQDLITEANLGVSGNGGYHYYPWSDVHFTRVDGLALINSHLFQNRVDLLEIVEGLEYVDFNVKANEAEAIVNLFFRSAPKREDTADTAVFPDKTTNYGTSRSRVAQSTGDSSGGCAIAGKSSEISIGSLFLGLLLFLIIGYHRCKKY